MISEKIINFIKFSAITLVVIGIAIMVGSIYMDAETIDLAVKIYIIATMGVGGIVVLLLPIGRISSMEKPINDTSTSEGDFYNHKGTETDDLVFKDTPYMRKGTIKLEPEDVKLDVDNECPGCKYAIDLSKKMVRELGPDWDKDWDIVDTHLEPHEDFYNIDVVLKRRDNDVR